MNADREHKWRYSNKEFESDFELNLYDSKARMYDQATGRFASIDPPFAVVCENGAVRLRLER